MKSKLFLKTMRKAFTILAGLLLLLAFAQCKKNKENQENEEKFELACDAIEYIDENMQSQLDLLNDKTTPEAMASLAEWIKNQEGVKSAVAYNDHVDIVYVNGSKGSVEVYDQTLYDDFEFGNRLMAPPAKQGKENLVGNQEVFIYDAFPYVFPTLMKPILSKLFLRKAAFTSIM